MLNIVRLSLQDRPSANANHSFIEKTIKVPIVPSDLILSPRILSLDASLSLSDRFGVRQCGTMEQFE